MLPRHGFLILSLRRCNYASCRRSLSKIAVALGSPFAPLRRLVLVCRSLVVTALCVVALGACAPPAYTTSFVTLSAGATVPLPTTGDWVTVRVEDGRKGVAGYEVGAKRVPLGYEASTISLKDKELLSDHVTQDVVGVLRERGYRAYDSRELGREQADVVVIVRIERFSVDVNTGLPKIPGSAVLVLEALQAVSNQALSKATVRADFSKEFSKNVFGGFSDSDYQDVLEGLYGAVKQQIREKIGAGFPR